LSKVAKKDRATKQIDGREYDLYRLRVHNDFVNNEVIKNKIEHEAKLHPEFKSYSLKDIVVKCIEELEKEGYVEREQGENLETLKEDCIYFIDKRKDLYSFVLSEIRDTGTTGLKFNILCNKVKADLSKFYNMEYLFTVIDHLFEQNQLIESEEQVYTSVE
jgi:hypothetical protein